MKEFPQLYAVTSTGKIKTWKITVALREDGTAVKTTTFGLLDGKLQDKVEIVREGKNLGKANETTPWEQAVSEAQSDWQKKVDKKYVETIPADGAVESDILLPMLALDFKKRKHDIVYPAYGQAKLNGLRLLAKKLNQNVIQYTSRKGKDFPEEVTAHFTKPLLQIMETGEIFDGEGYEHDWPFQKILRTMKKPRPWKEELQFHIFDVADTSLPYEARAERLFKAMVARDNGHTCLQFVGATQLHSEADVKLAHDRFVREGYEGVIVRNAAGLYVFDHRSKHLQKYKEFIDEEFKIVDAEYEVVTDPVTHKESRAVVWVCVQEDGLRFNVRPRGSVADRVKWYEERGAYFGKELTVRYQERSVPDKKGEGGNIPIFPVGIAIRDYE